MSCAANLQAIADVPENEIGTLATEGIRSARRLVLRIAMIRLIFSCDNQTTFYSSKLEVQTTSNILISANLK